MSNIQKAKDYMLKSSILGQSLFEFKYQEETDEVILIKARNGTGTIEIPEFIDEFNLVIRVGIHNETEYTPMRY